MFRVQPDQYSRRRATISPVRVRDIHRDRMARVLEATALEDIRLPRAVSRTANRKDIADRHTARHTAAEATTDAATRVLHIRAVVVIAPRTTAHALTAAATVHQAPADAPMVVATVHPPADHHLAAVVRAVALAAAAHADQVVGQATPADIANSQSEIKLLLSMPPLTGRLFFARPFTARPPYFGFRQENRHRAGRK